MKAQEYASDLIHKGLSERGLINLIVAMLAVAHNIHYHIALPLLTPLSSQLTGTHLKQENETVCMTQDFHVHQDNECCKDNVKALIAYAQGVAGLPIEHINKAVERLSQTHLRTVLCYHV